MKLLITNTDSFKHRNFAVQAADAFQKKYHPAYDGFVHYKFTDQTLGKIVTALVYYRTSDEIKVRIDIDE